MVYHVFRQCLYTSFYLTSKIMKRSEASKSYSKKIYTKSAFYLNKASEQSAAAYDSISRGLLKLKHRLPSLYSYFDNMFRANFISSRILAKEPSIANLGKVIASRIASILPHIDVRHVRNMNFKSGSFLESISTGLKIKKMKKDYTKVKKRQLFKRVLVANRGEIALRVVRACKELGIESVALYSKEEKDALSVKFADKSYCIGGSKNYLNINKILGISKKMGADAIHPGYGFLSENTSFARLCEKSRIKFIGPTSKMISVLGNKVQAKKSMMEHGVPVIEGIKEPLKNFEHAIEVARNIKYPVMVKASAGGGGKGMRIVRKEEELKDAYDGARNEAKNAFGDDSVYMEKYLEDPRHIEFQILADKHGNVMHLGERDCTIQRRHQKLVEEAPSTALDDELRRKMGDSAVKAVKAIKYEGAGTVEFLLDKNKNFYFIEMNTRIQVEHGVTEMITGVDLVKEQIKLAAGAKLAYRQEDVRIDGWAIECRINAEDPCNNFMPSPGTIVNYLPPGGPGIRISSSCHSGHKIEPHFDSLIALLICHGSSRNEALARMDRALDEYSIQGVKTTIPFHKSVLNNPEFARGNITTSFIERYQILDQAKKEAKSLNSEEISADKKIIIVTAAVNRYLAKKQGVYNGKASPWVAAARQEAMREGRLEE